MLKATAESRSYFRLDVAGPPHLITVVGQLTAQKGCVMTVSTDVNLPKGQPPVFPDRCVACGADHPGGAYRASTNAIGWWTLAFWTFGRRFTVEVPACEPCRDRMRRQRWVQIVVDATAIVIGVSVAISLLHSYHGAFKKWLVLVITLVCLLPVVLWETVFPRAFDMTAFTDTVDYEFRDAAYAEEFALLNQPTVEDSREAEQGAARNSRRAG